MWVIITIFQICMRGDLKQSEFGIYVRHMILSIKQFFYDPLTHYQMLTSNQFLYIFITLIQCK